MGFSTELIALAQYMAGEFDNQQQALADPTWYVHLRFWQRPLPEAIFSDSITLLAEQANILTLDQAYRSRVVRLQQDMASGRLSAQYYLPRNLALVRGAGQYPERLQQLTSDQLELLPGCQLTVAYEPLGAQDYSFKATLPENTRCCFNYENQTYQVDLGFEANSQAFLSFDRGINPATGEAIWGALLGPYRFIKQRSFVSEIPNL
ncbi:MAG: chorismate mutase [Oscillatoriales cyanobacterium RM1_1_9]|nr:chorismate mutase [Oscillatoriales cyanobacterium SM2_3_0]NJO47302.1 chorismate mutase [Oscillatoriales cyanobacterium RM2_1_1]NJO71302.1 chorismate mutase [Oscillatoriales cyanobacterium RM1_1_9]